MAKCPDDLRKWLVDNSYWMSYLARREALKQAGLDPADVARILAREWGPGKPNVPGTAVEPTKEVVAPAAQSSGNAKQPPPAAVDPAIWSGRPEPDERTVVRFVFDNMPNLDCKPKEAPSMGAWGLLKMCHRSPKFAADFYSGVWIKLLPSKLTAEETPYDDKCEAIHETLAKVEEAAAKTRSV